MKRLIWLACLAASAALAGCGPDEPAAAGAGSGATPVTVETAAQRRVEVLERSVARLEAPATPAVAAETAGRVVAIHADAGTPVQTGAVLAELDDEVQRNTLRAARANAERLQVLLENQQRTVARLEDLMSRNLAAESSLDDAVAQQSALKAQLDEAQARLADAERNLQQIRVRSPVDGVVQTRRISVGDFVAIGQALFDVVSAERLRAIAPYPETSADALRVGQTAYVAPVRAPRERITAAVTELRPGIGPLSRSVDLIVEFDNPNRWRPGGSVTVDVVIDVREDSLTVPGESVVRRPAGTVVYVFEDGVARQRRVETGVQSEGWIEILAGLEPGDRVIRSGAGFLTDGAPVQVAPGAEANDEDEADPAADERQAAQ
jgi:RND family efflux transporter MFP subunit